MSDYLTQKFIKKSIAIYGDQYDYDLVEYVNHKSKVIIICKIHDYYFEVQPTKHINYGKGCRLCTLDKIKEKRVPITILVEKAQLKHGNIYDYTESQRIGDRQMSIRCRIHGIFIQSFYDH